ncbi:ribosomal protein S18-alanine N-acetyltransferase [Leifsonia sp. F6_8S_P_1B]|uniref:Ribosomal protein S18-alanine N-acetyltransferase n=1 Tax=Leifsonia williamsii TaxID=3035919 RepID=A0ABT8KFF4_9MICO|nr:ribosomal protein S18-alanine N-acetyltransferase [Leifsonia williamsii]MDN4616178.1 ribosomal protein S18-alanine N-acetyltransferase [Leifsonia williamsii]
MTAWQLRRAGEDDVPAIMELERSTFVSDAWSERSMRSEVTGQHGYYLVAFEPEHPERIDGYAGLLAPRGSGEGDIQTIAVAPHARRHGLGRALMLALIGEARTRGARDVFLEVRADNPGAQTLYRALGFEEIGVRPRYYQPDGVDAIVMRLTVPTPETTLA